MRKLTGKGRHITRAGNNSHTNTTSKQAKMRREHKCRILEIHLKLREQQLKTILYVYRLLYQNLMITLNQVSTIDTHTQKEKTKQTQQDSQQIARERKRKERKKTYKTKMMNKVAIRTYISVGILNVNRLNTPIKRHRLAEWIQK